MGRHREWRKVAKKLRRKRIRTQKARERDLLLKKEQEEKEKNPEYLVWLAETSALELFQRQEEERLRIEAQEKWEQEEKEAQIRWKEQQERLKTAKAAKAKQELLIREEWEREQKKLKEEIERKKREEEEKERRTAELLERIDAFINGCGSLPEGAVISTETQPSQPDCPFFSKVGACRFRDSCSRNHKRPGISKVLLLPGFYSHFSLQHSTETGNEYDTDVSLEFNEEETYEHFLEFYDDVLSELKTFGKVTQFKVCRNEEPHLRGNVYVQFTHKREAMKAFRALQGRFYGGKQISVEFTNIPSWKNAICGLYQVKRCPKGKSCNFLHVFRNPRGEFWAADRDKIFSDNPTKRSRSRSRSRDRDRWGWSESPEPPSTSERRRARDSSEESRRSKKKSKKERRKEDESSEHSKHKRKKRKDLTREEYKNRDRSNRNSRSHSYSDSDHKLSERKSKDSKKRRKEEESCELLQSKTPVENGKTVDEHVKEDSEKSAQTPKSVSKKIKEDRKHKCNENMTDPEE